MLRVEVILNRIDRVAGEEVGEGGADFADKGVALRDEGEHGGDDEEGRKEAEDRRECCGPGERQRIVRERVQRGAPQLLEWTQHSWTLKQNQHYRVLSGFPDRKPARSSRLRFHRRWLCSKGTAAAHTIESSLRRCGVKRKVRGQEPVPLREI